MSTVFFAARKLVESNLGWFLRTRTTQGEAAGRERAININREVFDAWFPNRDAADISEIEITTSYYDGAQLENGQPNRIISNKRTIRNQGGGKNWRLAGDAIEGDFYDVRPNDLLFIAFDADRHLLNWVVVRDNIPGRPVSAKEAATYKQVLAALGKDSGSMWQPDLDAALRIISHLIHLYPPNLLGLLMVDRQMLSDWESDLKSNGFIIDNEVSSRFLLALKSKPFLILTGLSGSGKTLLARAFAHWLCASRDQFAVVPVGANWVSNENIVGYADALDIKRYSKTRFLEVLLRAHKNPTEPHILILDEMNLSHVERYFADFLSAIESPSEPIRFHGDKADRDDVPPHLPALPSNIFLIGTVNVDETTYMFSPKVLDRAQVIEFRASSAAIDQYMQTPKSADPKVLSGKGSKYAPHFLAASQDEKSVEIQGARTIAIVRAEIGFLFQLLSYHGQEIGIRSVAQMQRYLENARRTSLPVSDIEVDTLCRKAIDIAVLQKILPRLSGSRRRLGPLLQDLLAYCALPRSWRTPTPASGTDRMGIISNYADMVSIVGLLRASPGEQPPALVEAEKQPFYAFSHAKLSRIRDRLEQDGFAGFAEA